MVLKHTWLILAIICGLLYFKQGQKFLKRDKVKEKRGKKRRERFNGIKKWNVGKQTPQTLLEWLHKGNI